MFKEKLQYRIILLVFSILLVIGILGGAAMLYFQRQTIEDHFTESIIASATVLRDSLERDMLLAHREHIQQSVVLIASMASVNDVTIFSNEQRVFAASEPSIVGQTRYDEAISQAFSSGEMVTRAEGRNDSKNLYVIFPIFNKPECYGCHSSEQNIRGAIKIGMDTRPLDKQIQEQTLIMVMIAGVTFLIVGGGLTYMLQSTVVKPLSKLIASARSIAGGDFSARVEIDRDDEVGMMARSFNEMTEQVEQHSKALEVSKRDLEKTVQKRTEQLRTVSFHLESVREEEKKNLVREIHDELGQLLTGLKMGISWIAKRIPRNEASLVGKTEEMHDFVDEALERVKTVSARLRPAVLDHLGLVAAIEWQTQELARHTEVSFEFKPTPKDITLDPDRSTTIFRICQEAMTNVVRHANATKAIITLKKEPNRILLMVNDNGKGIDEQQVSDHEAFGLIGMRERAMRWGGEVKIKGTPGKGTLVLVSIPLFDHGAS